jgi:conserved oligomeric Golgi complex subunit 1
LLDISWLTHHSGNYRELLSTADQIVSLDSKTRAVEVRLSELGQLCGPQPSSQTKTGTTLVPPRADLWLLQCCVDAIQLSFTRTELLRAAQLLVICRLLLKSLNDHGGGPTVLALLQEKFTAFRRHAISLIDNVLTSPRSSSAETVRAACAYCLITSASSGDAFKYAQKLRLERLRRVLAADRAPAGFAVSILRYILSTSHVLRRVFSRALTDALSNLQRRPILLDLDLVTSGVVGSKESLALVSEDVRSFSPYFKREPVTSSHFTAGLDDWTRSACKFLLTALHQELQHMQGISPVLDLRRQLYSVLLPLYFSSASSQSIHESVRQQILIRVQDLLQYHADRLKAIATAFVDCRSTHPTMSGLWDHNVATASLTGGGSNLLSQVTRQRHGTGADMLKASKSLREWTSTAGQILAAIEGTRSSRWKDQLEDADDDHESEAQDIVRTLTEADPADYKSQARTRFKAAIVSFEAQVLQPAASCVASPYDHIVEDGVHYLRVIRISVQPLRQIIPQENVLEELQKVVDKLQQFVAEKTVARVLGSLGQSLRAEPSHAPSVDDLPSPLVFSLLHELCATMAAIGGHDVWSEAAITKTTSCMGEKVLTDMQPSLQRPFDLAYLKCALGSAEASTLPQVPAAEMKAAQEYWARTRLLFGILGGA